MFGHYTRRASIFVGYYSYWIVDKTGSCLVTVNIRGIHHGPIYHFLDFRSQLRLNETIIFVGVDIYKYGRDIFSTYAWVTYDFWYLL
jgi:hypothetical protein